MDVTSGYKYYFNTITLDSQWEIPSDGYVPSEYISTSPVVEVMDDSQTKDNPSLVEGKRVSLDSYDRTNEPGNEWMSDSSGQNSPTSSASPTSQSPRSKTAIEQVQQAGSVKIITKDSTIKASAPVETEMEKR